MSGFIDPENVTLSNLAGGAAIERFNIELAKVLENVLDQNMSAGKKRSITLKVNLKPSEDRDYASVEIECSSSLAPVASLATHFYIGKDIEGKAIANQQMMKQSTFAELQSETNDNVTSIKKVK